MILIEVTRLAFNLHFIPNHYLLQKHLQDEDGVSLSDVSRLDTMVTVVDAVNFTKDYYEAKDLLGESLGEEDQRSVVYL